MGNEKGLWYLKIYIISFQNIWVSFIPRNRLFLYDAKGKKNNMCVSGNILKKIRSAGRKKFLFYEKFLIELYRKTSGRKVVEAENSPKNFRSGVFWLGSAGYRKHTTFLFWPYQNISRWQILSDGWLRSLEDNLMT